MTGAPGFPGPPGCSLHQGMDTGHPHRPLRRGPHLGASLGPVKAVAVSSALL